MYTVYIRYLWLGNHQICGVYERIYTLGGGVCVCVSVCMRIYTVLANPTAKQPSGVHTAACTIPTYSVPIVLQLSISNCTLKTRVFFCYWVTHKVLQRMYRYALAASVVK
jgi:hypothetical protein